LVLVGVLVFVLVAVLAVGVVVVLRRNDDKPVATKAATPQAVEFRRVIKTQPGSCPSPGTFCDSKGVRYTLGKVELDGSHVTEVKAAQSDAAAGGSWYVGLTLDQEGTRTFGQLTTELAAKQPPTNQLAIVVRDEVVTAPTINAPLTASQVEIAGSYTQKDAEALADKITG
jgi:preprotein translocase subunit SecD